MTADNVLIEFSGGLETLFANQKQIALPLPDSGKMTVRAVIEQLREKHLRRPAELFAQGDSVRPGILVLVNDADWELDGGLESVVAPGDRVVFISTLHGG